MENTPKHSDRLAVLEDHLHTRGEYFVEHPIDNVGEGSPPHTWRILSKNTSFSEETRITSTHVENTKFNVR